MVRWHARATNDNQYYTDCKACVSDFEKILGFWEKFPIPHRTGESKPETEFPATTLRVRCGNPAHIPLLPKMEEPPTYQPNQ